MTTESLIAEGYEFAVYDAGDAVHIRHLESGNVVKSITGADAADMKDCLRKIAGVEKCDASQEHTVDLLSVAA